MKQCNEAFLVGVEGSGKEGCSVLGSSIALLQVRIEPSTGFGY